MNIEREFNMRMSKDKRKASVKECIWGEGDNSSCQGKIIKSHSIQRSKILQKISDNGKVSVLSPKVSPEKMFFDFDLEGTKKFSTFTGFCAHHDKTVFQPIEDKEFVGDREQMFIYAYRSASKEYHSQKESLHLYDDKITEINESINPDVKSLLTYFQMKSFRTGLSVMELQAVCEHLKSEIENMTFSGLKHHYYCIGHEIPVACSSSFIPYKDHNNVDVFSPQEKMNISINPESAEEPHLVFLNVFPENGKTHIIISYYKNMKGKYKFFSKMLKGSDNKVKGRVSDYIINYSENVAFSPTYINSIFSEEDKAKIKSTFSSNISDPNVFIKSNISLLQ
ncbi:hypothetical protein ACK1CN_25610 [Vibrio coralliilyticus]|uniref:hypothetical protein n=1 Tax=Vibrio coralliilyticus TaxID=190893 RepID=UPI00391714A0